MSVYDYYKGFSLCDQLYLFDLYFNISFKKRTSFWLKYLTWSNPWHKCHKAVDKTLTQRSELIFNYCNFFIIIVVLSFQIFLYFLIFFLKGKKRNLIWETNQTPLGESSRRCSLFFFFDSSPTFLFDRRGTNFHFVKGKTTIY